MPSSNTIWSSVKLVLSSKVIPPLTTEINPAAPAPFVAVLTKIKSSPIEYPVPALSIIISVIPPEPIVLVWIIAPSPPPVIVADSAVVCKAPSFDITFEIGIPEIVASIKMSSMSSTVPVIFSPTTKLPSILSAFKINSDIEVEPIKNLVTLSTIAVAFDVVPVIGLPTKLEVSPATAIALKTLFVVNLPSDTLKICSRG